MIPMGTILCVISLGLGTVILIPAALLGAWMQSPGQGEHPNLSGPMAPRTREARQSLKVA